MKAFNRNYMEQELKKINKHLKKSVTLYIIGGSAMSFYDLKTATKDIDVIVKSEEEAKSLINALKQSGYKSIEKIDQIYLQMKTRAIIENTDGFRWDIFVNKVCDGLTFSKEMVSRTQPFKRFENIDIYLVSPEDVFIFKAVTSRPRDREDMFTLFSHGLDIDTIKKEILKQSQIDRDNAWLSYFFVGLDELVEEYKVIFPEYDEFLELAENEMTERLILEFITKKPRTVKDLASILKCNEKEIRNSLHVLQKKGSIIKKDDRYLLKK